MATPNQSSAGRPPSQAKRYGFVDHFRGWAVLVMIETHSVNAWMVDSVRQQGWYGYVKMINGFVAPSFLFISGVSFLIVARKRFAGLSGFTPDFFRQLRRFLWVWALGYILHFPVIAFRGWIPIIPPQNLADLYKVDILQTIAVSLIVLLILAVILRDLNRLLYATLALAIAALLATPFLWKIDLTQSLHPAIANYLNGLHNPLFPLFPWSVFLWAGALTGGLFFARAAADDESGAIKKIFVCAALLFGLGYLGRSSHLVPFSNFWVDSPQWVMMRLGIVMAFFCLFWFLETRGLAGLAVVILLGTESLFAYVVHLLMIYSMTGDKAQFPLLGYRTFDPWTTFQFYLVLMAMVILLTWLWKRLGAARARRAKK